MKDRNYQLTGLIGFILSGLIFTASSIKQGDYLTLSGCLIWIFACIVWMVPLIKRTPDLPPKS